MSFFYEVVKASGASLAAGAVQYTIINFNGETLYIEGVKNILSISGEGIKLMCNKHVVEIIGQNLSVFDANVDCLVIKGKVTHVEEKDI